MDTRLTSPEQVAQLFIRQELVRPRSRKSGVQSPTLRGAVLSYQSCTLPEVCIEGPAGTGKSFGILWRLDQLAKTYDGCRILIVRKTRESLNESALKTLEQDVLGIDNPIIPRGQRFARHNYRYPNGSEIIVAGMTASGKDQRAKVMSTDYDVVYAQECSELLEEEWLKLTTRLRNRKMPFQQIIGDLNPDAPSHWLYVREERKILTILTSRHQDNPVLWDGKDWTEEGKAYLGKLSNLTGTLRERLFEGKRAMASGLVYGDVWSDGPVDGNVTDKADYQEGAGEVLWFVDDGYAGEYDDTLERFTATSHPRVFLLAQQLANGCLNFFAESYRVHTLPDAHLKEVREMGYPDPWFAVVDKSAVELMGRLRESGINTRPGPGDVEESIKVFRDYLAPDLNGVRLVHVHPRLRHFRFEMASYKRDDATGKVIKQHDHGPDCGRYGCAVVHTLGVPNIRTLG